MAYLEIVQEARSYVENNEFGLAIQLLRSIPKLKSEELDRLILFSNQWESLIRERQNNTISYNNFIIQKNKLTISVLQFLTTLLEKDNTSHSNANPYKGLIEKFLKYSFIKKLDILSLSILTVISIGYLTFFYINVSKAEEYYKTGDFDAAYKSFPNLRLFLSKKHTVMFIDCQHIIKGDRAFIANNHFKARQHYFEVEDSKVLRYRFKNIADGIILEMAKGNENISLKMFPSKLPITAKEAITNIINNGFKQNQEFNTQ